MQIKSNRNNHTQVHVITLKLPGGKEVGNYITTGIWIPGFIGWIEDQPAQPDGEWTLRLFFDIRNDAEAPREPLVELAQGGEIACGKLYISYSFNPDEPLLKA